MDPRSLEKARSRLRSIDKAIGGIETAHAFNDFTDAWFEFLTAFKSTYTTLQQGSKTSPQSMQWFGAKASERRGDELLQYLYHARNDEEHGLEDVAKFVPGRATLEITLSGKGSVDLSKVEFMGDRARLPSGEFAKVVDHQPPHVVLVPVWDRDKTSGKHQPPTMHLSTTLQDKSPLAVAKLARTYLAGMVKEAEGLK